MPEPYDTSITAETLPELHLAAGDQARRADTIKLTIRVGNPDVIASVVYPSLEASVFLASGSAQNVPDYLKFAPWSFARTRDGAAPACATDYAPGLAIILKIWMDW